MSNTELNPLQYPIGKYKQPEVITPEIRAAWIKTIATTADDLTALLKGVDETLLEKPYREGGIVLEELIQNAREYSWDYVAGSTWVTEKTTTEGAYRAEIQQVVPAPLTPKSLSLMTASRAPSTARPAERATSSTTRPSLWSPASESAARLSSNVTSRSAITGPPASSSAWSAKA